MNHSTGTTQRRRGRQFFNLNEQIILPIITDFERNKGQVKNGEERIYTF